MTAGVAVEAGARREALWIALRDQVFWDREVPYASWRAGFLSGHLSYFPQSILGLHPPKGVALLGKDAFAQAWPELRTKAGPDERLQRRLAMWDAAWSRVVSGDYGIRPLSTWFTLTPRCREFLVWVGAHAGTSIYAAAKALGMTYKRAFEHTRLLVEFGFVRKREDTSGPRRLQRLYAFSTF